jgi:proteasome lid subunit RPN8/RPN11
LLERVREAAEWLALFSLERFGGAALPAASDRLRNVTANPEFGYEAAPEDLFNAQRQMRDRGEELLAIYHSHPRAVDPSPSETDVRLAYYPSATYLIVGLGGTEAAVKAFSISEREQRWEQVEYEIAGE